MVTTSLIQESLKGIHYPANKSDLLKTAQGNNASQDVMDILNKLPDQSYPSPVDVNKAVSRVD
ncbi:MAG TPA: DUF2795 domain-containing protein [Deltaproteobacteria bacterium]|mgnify:CR=1 FL=1|jgi:hypothetical protein|nr:DUF2795 domain-containing protein [Deltaproteobacteria bacterium]HOI06691.1 DUF2795 domain-containing protein [Deltaproteobacteria bacterium]